ncbi:MAG TPA: ABC transporter ATP-binding protein [Vicinamibacteria bacterium]|nr:ABC transporter ATP-binding protein [Vicinamibacteria bacterium]
MLALEHVAVRYSRRPVLRDVSFSIGPREIVAYLGANGAGKTTTMKVVTGLREPDYGRVLFDGRDVAEDPLGYRRRLGYVPETADVYPFLSGREYLLFAGRLRALPEASLERRVDELLELLELGPHRHQALESYSKGMRQKVLIATALLHDPEVLVLDEPLSGLDVSSVLVMKALLRELAARGRAILYSTHHLEVAERLCERVLILHEGRVVADDSVANLRELRRRPSLEEIFSSWVLEDRPEATAARIARVVSGAETGAP